jgi:hypothetical protein
MKISSPTVIRITDHELCVRDHDLCRLTQVLTAPLISFYKKDLLPFFLRSLYIIAANSRAKLIWTIPGTAWLVILLE